jgi:hypothetical protein
VLQQGRPWLCFLRVLGSGPSEPNPMTPCTSLLTPDARRPFHVSPAASNRMHCTPDPQPRDMTHCTPDSCHPQPDAPLAWLPQPARLTPTAHNKRHLPPDPCCPQSDCHRPDPCNPKHLPPDPHSPSLMHLPPKPCDLTQCPAWYPPPMSPLLWPEGCTSVRGGTYRYQELLLEGRCPILNTFPTFWVSASFVGPVLPGGRAHTARQVLRLGVESMQRPHPSWASSVGAVPGHLVILFLFFGWYSGPCAN